MKMPPEYWSRQDVKQATNSALLGAAVSLSPDMPASEMGAVQCQIEELNKRLAEVFSNQEIIEQRLIPVCLPYPCSTGPQDAAPRQPACQIQDAISAACDLLSGLAQRQRMTLQHLQV